MTPSFALQFTTMRAPGMLRPLYKNKAHECNSLMRLAFAPLLSKELQQISPLTPLEWMAVSQNSNLDLVNISHEISAIHTELGPEHIRHMLGPQWSLNKDPFFDKVTPQTQLLMYRWAMLSRRCVQRNRGWKTPVGEVLKFIETLPEYLRTDSFAQHITAAGNPSLFAGMLESSKVALDSDAVAIGFCSDSHVVRRDWHSYMSISTFEQLICYESREFSKGNPRLYVEDVYLKDPKLLMFTPEQLPSVLEHNPALYLHNVVLNNDIRNSENQVNTWFKPMLYQSLGRCVKDAGYADQILASLKSPRGPKWFERTFLKYAPEEFEFLKVCESLYAGERVSKYDIYKHWLNGLVDKLEHNTTLPLPEHIGPTFDMHL